MNQAKLIFYGTLSTGRKILKCVVTITDLFSTECSVITPLFFYYTNRNWYWDEVNPFAATCYIQFGNKHFEYLQPLRPHNGDISPIKDNEIFIEKSSVRHPDQVLEGIVEHIIPLYIHVIMKKKIMCFNVTFNKE